jgi:hypothetical protein
MVAIPSPSELPRGGSSRARAPTASPIARRLRRKGPLSCASASVQQAPARTRRRDPHAVRVAAPRRLESRSNSDRVTDREACAAEGRTPVPRQPSQRARARAGAKVAIPTPSELLPRGGSSRARAPIASPTARSLRRKRPLSGALASVPARARPHAREGRAPTCSGLLPRGGSSHARAPTASPTAKPASFPSATCRTPARPRAALPCLGNRPSARARRSRSPRPPRLLPRGGSSRARAPTASPTAKPAPRRAALLCLGKRRSASARAHTRRSRSPRPPRLLPPRRIESRSSADCVTDRAKPAPQRADLLCFGKRRSARPRVREGRDRHALRGCCRPAAARVVLELRLRHPPREACAAEGRSPVPRQPSQRARAKVALPTPSQVAAPAAARVALELRPRHRSRSLRRGGPHSCASVSVQQARARALREGRDPHAVRVAARSLRRKGPLSCASASVPARTQPQRTGEHEPSRAAPAEGALLGRMNLHASHPREGARPPQMLGHARSRPRLRAPTRPTSRCPLHAAHFTPPTPRRPRRRRSLHAAHFTPPTPSRPRAVRSRRPRAAHAMLPPRRRRHAAHAFARTPSRTRFRAQARAPTRPTSRRPSRRPRYVAHAAPPVTPPTSRGPRHAAHCTRPTPPKRRTHRHPQRHPQPRHHQPRRWFASRRELGWERRFPSRLGAREGWALPSSDGNRLELGDVKGNVVVASSEIHCRPRPPTLSITPSGDVVGDRGGRCSEALLRMSDQARSGVGDAGGSRRAAHFH